MSISPPTLHPNPQGQPLRLTLGRYDFAAPAEVTVTDLMGRGVLHQWVTEPPTDLNDGRKLASGTYLIRIGGGGTSLARKVAIQ